MENKYTERQLISLKVASARIKIAEELRIGAITEEDLIWLMGQDSNFGLETDLSTKERLLQEIFNAPFLLCEFSSIAVGS